MLARLMPAQTGLQFPACSDNYSRSWIALAIAEDCYILLMCVIFHILSVHRFFDVPETIFAKLCHTPQVCSEIDYVLWVFIRALKFGVKPPIFANLWTQT